MHNIGGVDPMRLGAFIEDDQPTVAFHRQCTTDYFRAIGQSNTDSLADGAETLHVHVMALVVSKFEQAIEFRQHRVEQCRRSD